MDTSKIRQEKLRTLVEKHGLADIAVRVGRSKSQISNITSGWRNMGERLAREFEQSLSLPVGFFDQPNTPPGIEAAVLDRTTVPLVSWESLLADDSEPSNQYSEVIMAKSSTPKDARALEVKDRSMEPMFGIGDVVIFIPSSTAKPSQYVIAVVDGEPLLRKYREISKTNFELVPSNTDYAILSNSTSDIQIAGVVTELRKQFG